jgi:hypothetical protein
MTDTEKDLMERVEYLEGVVERLAKMIADLADVVAKVKS